MSSSNNLFSDSTSIDSGVDDLQNPKFDYTGAFDKQGFRDGYGCQTWDKPFQHKYSGYFLYNNMHDKGFYFIGQEDGVSFYDGQFYNNKLEGYGQVIYKDGRVHEGLFKDNRKFGPGVLTYEDETQDVGLWNGNYLIRLSISMSSDIVPSLCYNPANKIKLLRFKKIVPAMPEKRDLAKDVMQGLTNDQSLSQRYPELYNPHVRNENSLFFDRRLYDLAQLGSEDSLIEVLEDEAFVDAFSDMTDAEDSVCPCIDERCIQVTKQINEIETELTRIHEIRRKYEVQLQKCKDCCKSPPRVSNPQSPDASDGSAGGFSKEETKYNSKASIVGDSASSRHVVEKNLDQMRMQTSIVEELILSGVVNHDLARFNKVSQSSRKEESINKIYVNDQQFHSDISMNSSDQDKAIETYTCTCMDEEVPDVDFLVEQLEKLQKKEKFYHTVVNFLNKVMYKEFSKVNKSNSSKVVKLQVEDLLAWNNGKTSIEILQHSFRYRNFEKILSFNIKSVLIGDRSAFGKMGTIETTGVNFLKHCIRNEIDEVKRDLFHHNVYPDLSDARGNTGIHLAVTCDRVEIIKQLANVGSNLDAFNDECLTPLILAILRYIATINRVVFWDKAFLSEIVLNPKELDQVTQWRPHESLISIGDFIGSTTHLPQADYRPSTEEMKKSSEEMSTKIRSHFQSIKSSSVSTKININYLLSTSFIEDYERYKKAIAAKKTEEAEEKDVEMITRTIEALLHYGADPNVGDLPMKPVLLAIFSKNLSLVESLLQHAANPNSVTEEDMSALHILASLPFSTENVRMTEKFLKYSSDPNKKSASELWVEQNEELVGVYVSPLVDTDDYDGKTPLQMVVMRKDFDEGNVSHQCELVRVLIEYGALYDQYYLGHTLLSMAVLRGNTKLIEILNRYVELGQPLGENMGNSLTIFGLYRFPFVKPFNECKKTIDSLISTGMNPFNSVYDFSNIYEFFLYDSSNDVDFDIPRVRANLEAEDLTMRKLVYTDNTNITKDCNKLSVAYLKEIGRDILMNLYRYRAIQILLLFATEDLLYHKCLDSMAKFFTIEEAMDCFKFHIHRNKIILDDDYEGILLKVLDFIKTRSVKVKESKKNIQKNTPISAEPSLKDEILKLHKPFEVPNYLVMYALDSNPEKYEVCFHCLRKSEKKLLCCPCCGSVKFCSELCNKYNNKLGTKHSCNLLFYDEMKSAFDKPPDNLPLTGIDLLMMEAKQTKEEERQAELLRRQAEEEEKLRKHLRKSQKIESQTTLHEAKSHSRSLMERSTSVCFTEKKKRPKKRMTCCKKPSSFFICDEEAQMQPRTLNCGFHCGLAIPDVQIDDQGNIVREKEFCECYPLYKKEPESKEEVGDAKPKRSDQYSGHYSLSDIFGGALHNEDRKMREVEELDKLMDTFARDERRMSPINEPEKEELELEDRTEEKGDELPEITVLAKPKHKNLKSVSDLGVKKSKGKKSDTKLPKPGEEVKGKEKKGKGKDKKEKEKVEKPETTKKKKEVKEREEKKKPKKEKKVKSDTEVIKKKKEEKKEDKSAKKRKGKSKSESESSVIDKKKKKKPAKETSESSVGTEKKKKKKGKEDKSVGGSSQRDKKTMTKKPKEKKIKKKEEAIQVDVKHKGKKSKEPSSKSTASTKKKKEKRDKSTQKKTEKKKPKETKKKRRSKSKKTEKRSDKTSSSKRGKQKKVQTKKEERTLFDHHAQKSKRDVAISKTLASFRAVDSNMLNPEKILALSNADLHDFKRISRVYQYFLELIAKYFPDFDLSCLMLPFACFMDGQLYYKFADALPYYCRTYSTM